MTSTHTGFKLALKHCFEQLGKYTEVQREQQVLDKRVKGIDSERKELGSELAKVQKELEAVEKEKAAFELEVCHKSQSDYMILKSSFTNEGCVEHSQSNCEAPVRWCVT